MITKFQDRLLTTSIVLQLFPYDKFIVPGFLPVGYMFCAILFFL